MTEWITNTQACKLADCSPSTIRRKAREGHIQRKNKENRKNGYLYKKSDVENLNLKNRRRRWG